MNDREWWWAYLLGVVCGMNVMIAYHHVSGECDCYVVEVSDE